MSFGSKPTPPDPNQTASVQLGLNQTAAEEQNNVNSYNQTTPYGSLNYQQDPNSPNGYNVNVALSPQEQGLLNTQIGGQQNIGNASNALTSNFGSLYGSAPNLNGPTGQVAGQLNSWDQQYLQPIFNQQQSNLNNQLNNQGLDINDTAYQNAQNLLARNQGDVTNQYLSMNEPQAFSQAVTQYQLPLQNEQSLLGLSQAQGPSFQGTPTASIQPPNYTGVAEQNYAQQNQAYGQNLSGMFGLAGAGITGLTAGGANSIAASALPLLLA